MSTTLKIVLTLLKLDQVTKGDILSLLETINDVSTYGLRDVIHSLNLYRENILDFDFKEVLIKLIENIVNYETESLNENINALIAQNSYNFFAEVVTTINDGLANDNSLISVNQSTQILNYRIFHPPIPERFIRIGNLLFETNGIEGIENNGSKIFYKFMVKITKIDSNNYRSIRDQINFDFFYNLIGMSFINSSSLTFPPGSSEEEYFIVIDTNIFYRKIANDYNNYYSRIDYEDNKKMDKILGIEKCHVDFNGLILVPELFFVSLDNLYDPKNNFLKIIGQYGDPNQPDIKHHNCSITVLHPVKGGDASQAISILRSLLEAEGCGLEVFEGKIFIRGYDYGNRVNNYNDININKNLKLESNVSKALKKLCQRGNIGLKETYQNKSINEEKEIYKFAVVDGQLQCNYSVGKFFMLYFNRSIYNNVENFVNKSNNLKKTRTKDLVAAIQQNNGSDNYNNYLPTKLISLKNKDIEGFSFVPFAFTILPERDYTLFEGPFSLYGSEFCFEKVEVRKIIKLSNKQGAGNINQIVIESLTQPIFLGDQPLKIIQINSNRYICLFKIGDQIEFEQNGLYNQRISENQDVNEITSCLFIIDNFDTRITKSKILRYFIETLTIENDLKSFLYTIAEYDLSLNDVFNEIKSKLNLPEDIINFLDYLLTLNPYETITDSIIDIYVNGDEAINEIIDPIRVFIKSIQAPVKSINYPQNTDLLADRLIDEYNQKINSTTQQILNFINVSQKFNKNNFIRTEPLNENFFNSSMEKIEQYLKANKQKIILPNNVIEIAKILEENSKDFFISTDSRIDFGDSTGNDINIDFLIKASENFGNDMFLNFIKIMYESLTCSSYKDIIIEQCKLVTSDENNFTVIQKSLFKYNVLFMSSLKEDIKRLDDKLIDENNFRFIVLDNDDDLNDFGEQNFDPKVYCMFELRFKSDLNYKKIISKILKKGFIYYTYVGDKNFITDLSIVSFYNRVESFNDSASSIKFFLPFNYNNGKLIVYKANLKRNSYELLLLNKTVEVEFIMKENLDENLIKNIILRDIIDFSYTDANSMRKVRSLCLGYEPVRKNYFIRDRTSHYFFTEDLKDTVISGTYDGTHGTITSIDWSTISTLDITIHPISSYFCKIYYNSSNINHDEILDLYLKKIEAKYYRMKFISDFEINNYREEIMSDFEINNFNNEFRSDFEINNYDNDEILVVNNNDCVYTKIYGKKSIEAKMANGIIPYDKFSSSLQYDNISHLIDFEESMLKERNDELNEKIRTETINNNLTLAISSIKWNSKEVETYRFSSTQAVKWIKFSDNSYFMALGFQSGVKIYIKSGIKYVYCSNLHHESVNDIIFGNKIFCITIQYENIENPFALLWIAASAIKIDLELKFYYAVTGDLANISYVAKSGETKDLNNAEITKISSKYYYKDSEIQKLDLLFDHNIFIFSPDDNFLIFNDNGTFKIFNLKKLSLINITSINSIPIVNNTSIIKCIQDGSWINLNTFIGITYSDSGKRKIILEVGNSYLDVVIKDKSPRNRLDFTNVETSELLIDFPTQSYTESMFIKGKVENHPLYSFLMDKRNEYKKFYSSEIKNGIWIYDIYVFLIINEYTKLCFMTLSGLYSFKYLDYEFGNVLDNDYTDQLIEFVSMWRYDTVRKDDSTISIVEIIDLDENVIFNVSNSVEPDFNLKINYEKSGGYYYSFHNDIVYVWKYFVFEDKQYTELTQIDSNGYKKFKFDDFVIVITNSSINIGVIIDRYTYLSPINNRNNSTNPEDISNVSLHFNDISDVNVQISIDNSVETYNKVVDNNLNVDSTIISSKLCLNRFKKSKIKSHINSESINFFTHGNLIVQIIGHKKEIVKPIEDKNDEKEIVQPISYKNNEQEIVRSTVRIFPKRVQTSDEDKMNIEWYNNFYDGEPCEDKMARIHDYQTRISEYLPTKTGKTFNISTQELKDIFGMKPTVDSFSQIANFTLREMLIRLKTNNVNSLIKSFIFIFGIFGDAKHFELNILVDVVKAFWDNYGNNVNGNKFIEYLTSANNGEIEENYNLAIYHFANLFGDNFRSYQIGYCFHFINLKFLSNGKIHKFDGNRQLLDLIYKIPIPGSTEINIISFESFSLLVNKELKKNLNRYYKMLNTKSEYEKYKSLVKSDLIDLINDKLATYVAYVSKIDINQIHPDFILKSLDSQFDKNLMLISIVYNQILDFITEFPPINILSTLEDEGKLLEESMIYDYEGYIQEIFHTAVINLIAYVKFISTYNLLESQVYILRKIFEIKLEVIPITDEIIETYGASVDTTDENILKYNSKYQLEELNYYYNCLKNRNYLHDIKYKLMEEELTPLLYNYRNCINGENIGVTVITIEFPGVVNSVKNENDESKNIIFEYQMDESLIKYGHKYGKINLDLVKILKDYNENKFKQTLKLKYEVNHSYSGVDFTLTNVRMEFDYKYFNFTNDSINFSKKNISLGCILAINQAPTLILNENDETVIFTDNDGSKFIAYYGNYISNKNKIKIICGFIIKQQLIDRRTTTYLIKNSIDEVIKKITNDNSKSTFLINGKANTIIHNQQNHGLHIDSIVYNTRSDNIIISERIVDRRSGAISIQRNNINILLLLANSDIHDELSDKLNNQTLKSKIEIKNFKILTKNNITCIVSNYKSDQYFGTIVEILKLNNQNKTEHLHIWNFYMFEMVNFDFNKEEFIIVGFNKLFKDKVDKSLTKELRIGIMKINTDKTNNIPVLINCFNREIIITDNIFNEDYTNKNTINVNVNIGNVKTRTCYIVINKKLIIFNKYNTYEINFINSITSIKVSKENGYVALYFGRIGITEIWNCNGRLHERVKGECNWC